MMNQRRASGVLGLLSAVVLLAGEPAASQDQYLLPTFDIQSDLDDPGAFHSAIVDKANELQTPLRMLEFVHDEIDYEVYYGSKKGALGALWSGRGNDFDQASLLIGLLRARGYRARYVIGVVRVPMDQAMEWAGVRFPYPTRRAFYFAYCNAHPASPACATGRFVYDPNDDSAIQLEHAWVEVEASAVYRGLEVGEGNLTWIPLDPSWKRKNRQPGIDDLPFGSEQADGSCPAGLICFRYDDYYSKVDPRLPSEIWEEEIRDWLAANRPGKTSSDVPYDGPIQSQRLEVLPLSLPFDPESTFALIHTHDIGALSELPPVGVPRRWRMSVSMRTGSAAPESGLEFWIPAIIDQRITLSFVPNVLDSTAFATALSLGGYVGAPYSGSTSLKEFCLASGNSTRPECQTYPIISFEGQGYFLTAEPFSLGLAGGAELLLDRDVIPGIASSTFDGAKVQYKLTVGGQVGIGLDVQSIGEGQVRHRVDQLLDLREQYKDKLVDEGDQDLNGNGAFGELLLDQGTAGIQTNCNYSSPTALSTCDLALSVLYTATGEKFIGGLLSLASNRYFQRLRDELRRLTALDRAVDIPQPWVGIAKTGVTVEYLFDHPVGVLGSAPIIDIRGFRFGAVDVDCATACPDADAELARSGKLMTHLASALEHQVWEELTGRQFLSTVKGFQIVRERFPERDILRVDSSNAGSLSGILDAFPYDPVSFEARVAILVAPSNDGYSLTPLARAVGEAGAADVFYAEYPLGNGAIQFAAGIVTEGITSQGATLFENSLFELQTLGFPPLYDSNLFGSTSFLAADPVSMVSGNNYLGERDLLIPTNGPPFEFERGYNSQSTSSGELGFGWSHTYEQRVVPTLEEQEFAYLPSGLVNFAEPNDAQGALSDTFDTWSQGTGSTERITWSGLPTAFTQKTSIDGLRLELAYQADDFQFEVWQGGSRVFGPVTVEASVGGVDLEEVEVPANVSVGSAIEVRLTGFSSADRLYFARVAVSFRGPRLERVELPKTPSSTSNWGSGTAQLVDGDPSTCVAPTSSSSSLTYPPPADVAGGFALEISAAVDPASSDPNAILWLGPQTTGVRFLLGPNDNVPAARQRFITTNLSQLSLVSYQADSPLIPLCHVERTLLRFRDQVEFVRPDGVHERFSRVGTAWEPAPGVRGRLVDVTPGEGGPGYRIVQPDGSELEFLHALVSGYRLTKISDAQGRSLILAYSSTTQRLQSVSEEGAPSRQLTFSYDGAGFIDQISDWSGRVWDYTVDANGDLREFKDPLAVQQGWPGVQYAYESGHENDDLNHNLNRVTHSEDRNGDEQGDRWVEFTYFNDDKVESHTDSLGNRQTFLFNLVRLENQTTDPRGFTTVYRHDTKGNLVQRVDPDGAVWSWAYDENRNVISETDPLGRVRHFDDFDLKGNPGEIIDRDGKSILLTYDDLTGAPETIRDKRGNTRTIEPTSDGLPKFTYATIGGQPAPGTLLATNFYTVSSRRLSQTVEELGDGTARVRHTFFFYEEPGDPTDRDLSRIEARDENGNVIALVEYDYWGDDLGRRRFERVQREASASDPTLIELVTETEYDARDQLTRVTRPDGTIQVSEYDENGNVTRQFLEEHRPDGQLAIHGLTQLFYDTMDRLVRQVDAAGGETTYAYDASGNRVSVTDPEGHTWRTEYDAMNRPIRVIDPNGAVTETRHDLAGRVVATTDATGIATQRTYDEIGRLIAYQYGDRPAATREVFYGPGTAYREELTDPEDRLTKYEFDDLGQVFRTTNAATGVTQVAYNLLGSAQTITDPVNKQTVFTFDALGRTRTVKPYYTTGVETLEYDRTGNVIRRTSQDGCALDQVYDAMGRLVSRFTSNEASCPRVPVGDAFGYDARGLLVAAQNDAVGLIREYDALGRMLREIDTRFGTGVGYAWDRASRLTSKVYPDGSGVHYAYDGAGRTVGISDPFGDTTRLVYDAAGRRLQKLGTQGLRTEYAYDPGTAWLTGVASYTDTDALASAFAYPSHDDVGNRLAMTETNGGETSYGYDALDRLERLDPPDEALFPANGAETWFAYDGAGNRTIFGPKSGSSWAAPLTTYAYDTEKRLATIRVDGVVVERLQSYDANGNPGSWTPPGGSARTLGYDALGRLVAMSGGFSASYTYDPFGRRIEKSEQGTTTRYQYDGLDVVAEYSASLLEATYVFGPGIDEVLKLRRGATVAAYHTDGLGSVVAISEGGTLRNTYRYDAFGKPIAQGGSSPVSNAYTYTGRELDASGLYYYRARYYLPSAGRFITPDPIGLAGGMNAYAYVGSNPINYTDPFGLMAGQAFGPAWPDLPLLEPDPLLDVRLAISPLNWEIEEQIGWTESDYFRLPTMAGMADPWRGVRSGTVTGFDADGLIPAIPSGPFRITHGRRDIVDTNGYLNIRVGGLGFPVGASVDVQEYLSTGGRRQVENFPQNIFVPVGGVELEAISSPYSGTGRFLIEVVPSEVIPTNPLRLVQLLGVALVRFSYYEVNTGSSAVTVYYRTNPLDPERELRAP